MTPTISIAFIILIALIPILSNVLKVKRAGSNKYQHIITDFLQNAETMLDTDEQIEAVCGYKPCAAITNKRLLVSTKNGIDSVAFNDVKKLNGMTASGNNTKYASSMLVFQIKANKKYTLGNHSEGFEKLVTLLYQRTGL